MPFNMQASNPRTIPALNATDESIGEAMETIFPLSTESAYMIWNGIHIPIDYKYALSFLLADIVMMLERLGQPGVGELTIHWPSNDFSATWRLKWDEHHLRITTEWHSVVGSVEALLAERSTLDIDKEEFVFEWKQVLGVLLHALVQAGYDDERLQDLPKLRAVHGSIREPGKLYK